MSEILQRNLELLGKEGAIAPLLLAQAAEVPLSDGELTDWFASLNLEGIRVLFVYGLGEGSICRAAESWLKADKGRYLVVLEEDLGILRHFLEQKSSTALLKKKRVRIYPLIDTGALARYYSLCQSLVVALPSYKGARGAEVVETLEAACYRADAEAENELNPNVTFYEGFYENIRGMEGDLLAEPFFGRFAKTPAILCGAGPSLEQVLPLLEQMKERAIVIGGGSALTALGKAGIAPHFGAGLSSSMSERDRFERANLFEVPLFYSPRICPAALKGWGGPRIAALSGDQEVCRWFARELGGAGIFLQEGPSVAGLMLELAYQMGCDPIIFVGVDLAFTEGKDYAEGVAPLEGLEEKVEGKRTSSKWVSEAAHLGDMVAARPGRRYLNGGEGLAIPGVESINFEKGLAEFLPRDLEGEIRAAVVSGAVIPAVEPLLDRLKESLQRVIALVEEAPTSGELALFEVELEEELAYRAVLERMVFARKVYLERIYDEFLAVPTALPQLIAERESALVQERLQFLKTAAEGQLQLIG